LIQVDWAVDSSRFHSDRITKSSIQVDFAVGSNPSHSNRFTKTSFEIASPARSLLRR
jgi:hypothetical protein